MLHAPSPALATGHRRTAAALLALTLLLTLLLPGTSSQAADPGEGTVGPSAPSLTWAGAVTNVVFPTGDNGETNACPPASADPGNDICDHFTLTVDVPEDFYASGISGGVRLTVSFEAGDDYEVAVFRNDEDPLPVASSISANNPEVLFIDKAFGTYEVRVSPYLATNPYAGLAEFVIADNSTAVDPRSPGFQAFHPTVVGDVPPEEDFDNPAAPWAGPILAFEQSAVGRDSAEPTIGVDKDGDMFYAAGAFDALPAGSPRQLARTEIYRSTDDGKTWVEVTPKVAGQDIPPTTLDPYVYVEEDSGRVFDVDLLVADKAINFSDDKGETWTAGTVDVTNSVQDHQTIFAGPVPAGSGLVTLDPAFPEIAYYCFNKIAEAVCSRSLDGGLTFQRTGMPAFLPAETDSNAAIPFCGSLHGHVATGPNGELYLPKGHCNQPWLAVSFDAGTTWETSKVSEMGFPEQQGSVAADTAGNLYYVWYDDVQQLPYLAISQGDDIGFQWSEPMMIAPPGVTEVQWPTVYAGDEGRISVGFPCTRAQGEAGKLPNRPWDHCMVMSIDALEENPTFISNISNPIEDPVHRGECPGRCGNMYDFLDVVVSPVEAGGRVYAAFVDTCTDTVYTVGDTELPPCNSTPTATGFDGDADNASAAMDGYASRQISGPSLYLAIGEVDGSFTSVPQTGDQPAPAPAPTPAPALPTTGGGLVLATLASLGGAEFLRRRRAA